MGNHLVYPPSSLLSSHYLLSNLMHEVRKALNISLGKVQVCTNSTIHLALV